MKVVSYLGGIPSVHKNPEKSEMLVRFAEGVRRLGDTGIEHYNRDLLPADVGVIQGWVHEDSPKTPHLKLRRRVSENTANRHTIIIDSNLFNYTGQKQHQYHRYSMDGVFPNTGNYFNNEVNPARWQQIQREYNISLKDWRSRGTNILVCLQRNGGWSMSGMGVVEWLLKTVKRIRKHTDRPIVVRPHPGDKKASIYLTAAFEADKRLHNSNNVHLSTQSSILDDFNNTWAVVTYNSSPGVAAAIEGLPVFVTDPFPNRSQAFPVANELLSTIENPTFFEREPWIEKICMSHWKFEELTNGNAWALMRGYCK